MFILGALLVFALLWMRLAPPWAPRPPDLRSARAKAVQLAQTVSDLVGRVKFRRKDDDLPVRFKQWVATEGIEQSHDLADRLPAESVGLRAWLDGLPEQEAAAFSQQVEQFVVSQQLDINWLGEADTPSDPRIKQAVADTVLLYSVACWRAIQVHAKVHAVKALDAFLAAPTRGANKAFGQQLFAALDRVGLVKASADLMLAAEPQRLKYMITAIQQAMLLNPDLFHAVLYTVTHSQTTTEAALAPAAPLAVAIT